MFFYVVQDNTFPMILQPQPLTLGVKWLLLYLSIDKIHVSHG